MTPGERCQNAIAAGKYASVEAWCAAVLVSDDARVPADWKTWAKRQLDSAVGSRSWAWLLAAKRDRGDTLLECQARAIKQVLGDERRIEAQGEDSGGEAEVSE